uniref:serine/arginine repetitive matrix protein 2-like n=1 Tax=Styela clava TaxID=7725 RepID=UPI001939EFAF|nr:serine/arginine repetitive matrix protein 2-like [Styela clava]
MSSSNSKRRKVTVDIKQTKLERGSVFERLGNQEKHKKWKDSSEGKVKTKKTASKEQSPSPERKKKSKSSSKSEDVPTKKSSKEYTSGSSKSKHAHNEVKEQRKSHKHVDNAEANRSGAERTHSKHKSDRGDGKVHKIVENLIIEKRVSPSTSQDRSRSGSFDSVSPRKKSKKRSAKHSSQEESTERYDRQQSFSPEPVSSSHRQKERGRSREKKKASKEVSRKNKTEDLSEEYFEPKPSSKSVSKVKKLSKQDKYEKEYSKYDEDIIPEKKHKTKHSKEIVVEKERSRKQTPVLYEESSDDHYRKKDVKSDDRGKAKRRKHEPESPSKSPVRHKKAKRQPSFEREIKETVKERSSKASASPTKILSSKKRHREEEVVSKKRVQKEDSLQGTYSDYSSASKHSQPEYSEISQTSGGNEELYSSDSYAEKETKKRSKMKKKVRKELEKSPSKVRYEVIDDDGFSDDVKKVKKRKRKREEPDSPLSESPVKEERRYHGKERRREEKVVITKKVEQPRSPREDSRRSDKHLLDRSEKHSLGRSEKHSQDSRDLYEHRNTQHERNDSSSRVTASRSGKTNLRSPVEKYYDPRKDERDRRKDPYTDIKRSSRDDIFSPDRRETNYVKQKLDARHLSAERSSEIKVAEWQRKSSKHISNERKGSIPKLMQNTRLPEPRFAHQRKLLEPEYIFQQHPPELMRTGRSFERQGRGNERMPVRPPPLLPPPSYSRSHVTPPHAARGRGMIENDRRMDRGQNDRRDPNQRMDSGDRKYTNIRDNSSGDRLGRSSSHDSRSSSRHISQDNKSKSRQQSDRGDLQSPRSDRNSSLERRKKTSSDRSVASSNKGDKNTQYDRRSQRSIERTVSDGKSEGRPLNRFDNDRSRSVKRKPTDEPRQSNLESNTTTQERKKQKSISKHPSPDPKRKSSKDTRSTSSKRSSENRKENSQTSRKSKDKKKTSRTNDTEINKLIEKEEIIPEVDWNELPTTEKDREESSSGTSSILSKFTPGNLLKKTGIILEMLPPHLAEKVNKMRTENDEIEQKESQSIVGGMLRNGLNSYSDEKLRKRLLGYNNDYRHALRPPFIINAKTYSASLKEYMRKSRMVEAM